MAGGHSHDVTGHNLLIIRLFSLGVRAAGRNIATATKDRTEGQTMTMYMDTSEWVRTWMFGGST